MASSSLGELMNCEHPVTKAYFTATPYIAAIRSYADSALDTCELLHHDVRNIGRLWSHGAEVPARQPGMVGRKLRGTEGHVKKGIIVLDQELMVGQSRLARVRVPVLPDYLAGRRHLEKSSLGARVDKRIAVR
jgi:hypothetical protein